MKFSIGPDLEQLKIRLAANIDAQAEAVRHSFITPGDGQAMTYMRKEQEARAFVLDATPSEEKYPHIYAEAARSNRTRADVAQEFIAMADAWANASVIIEDVRLNGKVAITSATTIVEAFDAARAVDFAGALGL